MVALSAVFTLLCGCATTEQAAPTSANGAQTAAYHLQWAEQYMAATSAKADIKKASDGVYYRKLKAGYGCHPAANSNITVHYEAFLAESNQLVDSSYQRGRAPTFPLSKMIAAWRTAIPMMAEGDTWELYVHPQQAYGSRGSRPSIPPNAAMKFTVNLLKADTCQHAFQRR
jgi:FKBP-type peptidyl-prolyl cis-trans isomerase FklB